MIVLKDILKDLCTPFDDLGVDKVMPQVRDKSVPEKMDSFVVVSLPVTIYNKTYGEGYDLYNTFCRVEIFVRKKAGTIHLKRISELAVEAQKRFPISTDLVLAYKPRLVLDGDDNEGFSVVTIQATLQIK